jgi:hypothetical protein
MCHCVDTLSVKIQSVFLMAKYEREKSPVDSNFNGDFIAKSQVLFNCVSRSLCVHHLKSAFVTNSKFQISRLV